MRVSIPNMDLKVELLLFITGKLDLQKIDVSMIRNEPMNRRLAEMLDIMDKMLASNDDAAVAESRDASRGVMREHLEEHLTNNPTTTCTGWISHLHPENMRVDPRLESPGSELQVIWAEVTEGHGPEGSSCGCWDQFRRDQEPEVPEDEQPAGDVRGDVVGKGLVDHVVAVALGFGMIAAIALLCCVRGLMQALIALLRTASAKADDAASQTPTPAAGGDKKEQAVYVLRKCSLTCAKLLAALVASALELGVFGTIIGVGMRASP